MKHRLFIGLLTLSGILGNTEDLIAKESNLAKVATTLNTITVVATKTEQSTFSVPVTVSEISDERLEQIQPQSLDDVLQKMPNVEMSGGPRRVSEKPIIRGLSDRRILITIDGVRQNFQSGHKGVVFLDPDLLKSVEVIRGPASALYGSDALGGVIAMKTKEVSDLLRPDQTWGFRIKSGYQSANSERQSGGAIYGQLSDDWEYFLYATGRDAGNIRQGGGEVLKNSGDHLSGGLAKLVWTSSLSSRWLFDVRDTYQVQEVPINTEIADETGDSIADRRTRDRSYRVGWEWQPVETDWIDLNAMIYYNELSLHEKRFSDNRLDEVDLTTTGGELRNTTVISDTGPLHQVLTYGVELYEYDQQSRRNREDLRFFPEAHSSAFGVYFQDEITWKQDTLIIPGIRFDQFYSEASGEDTKERQSQVSPKIGITFPVATDVLGMASHSYGFRAPHIQEMFIAGQHFGGSPEGIFVPNSDLKPERARNTEVGVRVLKSQVWEAHDTFRFDLTYFHNHIEDFISSEIFFVPFGETAEEVTCNNRGGCLFFQERNIQTGILQGIEAELKFHNSRYGMELTYARTEGRNAEQDDHLLDIPPGKWMLNLQRVFSESGWVTGWRTQIVETQDRIPEDSDVEETPGYTLFDVYATWHPSFFDRQLRVDLGIDNVSDAQYRKHRSFLDEAGRNWKISLAYLQ